MSSTRRSTIFGSVPEKNVYFLIDTSGSMYHQLPFVKEHLIEVLSNRASISEDTMFNIIDFKEDVEKWADKLVQCTPTTVSLATRWIQKLSCGTSTNTMAALLEAFQDRAVEAVYMVTDGLPDQRTAIISEKLRSMAQNIPVHSIYINGTYSDPAAQDFLRDLAEQTQGSFHIVTLSQKGEIQRVVPVYKTSSINRYDGLSLDHTLVSMDCQRKPYIDLERPPASGYVSRIYTRTPVAPVDSLVPLPHTLYTDQVLQTSGRDVNSKILDYADAVIKAKSLASSAGIRSCSTPVACSLMKDIKVLARHDLDGLYYLGEVKEQGPSETFTVKFDQCSAMRKPVIQDTSVGHMIAYKDAIRSHVSLGDKVLAPWQQDGRYGPGTVLDGIDRRDMQYEGKQSGQLLINFFNGETVEVQAGVAVRVPQATFERIARELQLPVSQRRKLKLADQSIPPAYDNQEKTVHKREKPRRLSTRFWQEENTTTESDRLRRKIDKQIKENGYLLDALDLGDRLYHDDILGKATSSELRGYDSGIFSDDGSGTSDNESKTTGDDSLREDIRIRNRHKEYDLGHHLRFSLPEEIVLSKSDGQAKEPKKRWRYWSGCAPARQPRFRKTLLEKPREPGDKMADVARPGYEEYQTVAGVSFPAGTDRKFGAKSQVWHPYRQFGDGNQKENVSAVGQRNHLKHSEYQDVSGVGFPSTADKKFTRSIDPNWRPETAMRNAEKQQNWEDGVGNGDEEKNARYNDKLERKRSNQRRYFKDIEDKVAVEERKEGKIIENRRQRMTERNENLVQADEEQRREKTDRIENKTARQAEILRNDKERTEKHITWKSTRIEFRQERQAKYLEIEENNDKEQQSREAKRQARRRIKDHERREDFHEKLREQWRSEDERVDSLQRKNDMHREKTEKRQKEIAQMKEARWAAKRERLENYRASVLP